MDTDEQRAMVDHAREGDGDAWERLYRNVYPRLHSYAVRHAGANVGEDLVNETMARAVAGIDRFRWEAGGFDAWLFGILRRVCAEHHRRQGRRRREMIFEGTSNGSEPGDDIERADDHAEVTRRGCFSRRRSLTTEGAVTAALLPRRLPGSAGRTTVTTKADRVARQDGMRPLRPPASRAATVPAVEVPVLRCQPTQTRESARARRRPRGLAPVMKPVMKPAMATITRPLRRRPTRPIRGGRGRR